MRKLIFLLPIALCVMLGRASADDRAEARAHYQAGVQLYNGGDYRGAIHEFTTAQQLLPADLNSYNLALCYDKLGEADTAISYYHSYLDRVPSTDKRAEIEGAIKRLEPVAKAAQQKKADDAARADADRKAAEEKAARDAAAAQPPAAPVAPPAPTPGVGVTVTPNVTPAPAAPAPTGDPQLDAINGVDINGLRSQRGMGGQPAPAGQPMPGQVSVNGQVNVQGQVGMNGQATANPNMQGQPPGPAQQGQPAGPMANNPAGQPLPGDKPAAADPIYKKWWFWVVVGVSVYVVYEIANDNSQPSKTGVARQQPTLSGLTGLGHVPPSVANRFGPGGFTLLSW